MTCKSTNVMPSQKILMNNVEHAGVVTHACCQGKDHAGLCVCKCGQTWVKNVQ